MKFKNFDFNDDDIKNLNSNLKDEAATFEEEKIVMTDEEKQIFRKKILITLIITIIGLIAMFLMLFAKPLFLNFGNNSSDNKTQDKTNVPVVKESEDEKVFKDPSITLNQNHPLVSKLIQMIDFNMSNDDLEDKKVFYRPGKISTLSGNAKIILASKSSDFNKLVKDTGNCEEEKTITKEEIDKVLLDTLNLKMNTYPSFYQENWLSGEMKFEWRNDAYHYTCYKRENSLNILPSYFNEFKEVKRVNDDILISIYTMYIKDEKGYEYPGGKEIVIGSNAKSIASNLKGDFSYLYKYNKDTKTYYLDEIINNKENK